ncbi:Conserved_hypothetical protein [Hexamita inflata]|uniref:Uncharacterized protein n=1 Tax=Hexamita inflata TaxID=28002 RepID=A0AA86QMW0_9EUKA|nr:Conserved hypothetical protein [Hexamita inflata]
MAEELGQNYENTMIEKYKNQITNQELHLASNPFQSIKFVEKLDVTSLSFYNCLPLVFDTYLSKVKQLDINCCIISETSSIQKMIQLIHLSLTSISQQCPLINIHFVSNLVNLSYLNLSNNKINNISAIKQLTNLQILELWHNQISDITPLAKLTLLTELILGENKISDISSLNQLSKLQKCDLQSNNLDDIAVFKNWTSIQVLELGRNYIKDISVFNRCQNHNKLKILQLSGNILTDISPIRMLKSLEDLDISVNSVISIQDLSLLSNLVKLDVNNCLIIDISVLNGLNNLTQLNVENNCISDLQLHNMNQFDQYLISDQRQPTHEQILFASKLKCISTQNQAIESIRVNGHQMNQTIQKHKLQVNKVLTVAVQNQYCFMNHIVQLLNQVKVEVLQ